MVTIGGVEDVRNVIEKFSVPYEPLTLPLEF